MKKMKKDSTKMKIMVILGIIILPLVYSLFYLKGFWDPYNSLDSVPVALVNLDECSENCKGTELIDNLKSSDSFDFKVVSEKKADEGLVNKDYYAVIKIPKDFTASLESADSANKTQATITYTPNTKTSYLASQIIGSAVKQVESSLKSEVSKEVTHKLTDNLKSVPEQTKQISSGLGTIHDGAASLSSGINTLNTNYIAFNNGVQKLYQGSTKLATSYKELDSGINDAYNGAKKLKDKTANLNSLTDKIGELKEGSENLNSNLKGYQTSINTAVDKVNTSYNSIISYYESLPADSSLKNDANLVTAYKTAKALTTADSTGYDSLQKLQFGTQKLVAGSDKLNAGINLLAASSDSFVSLKSGIDSLESGLLKIKYGSTDVLNGINSLNDGASTLSKGSVKIDNGISTLNSGASTLSDGTLTAKNEVDNSIEKSSSQVKKLDGLDEFTKSPVKVNEKDYGNVKDYGTFFSPYFMSLSLWVGGILILMGLYYDPDHRFKILGRNSENRGKRLVFYNIIGIIQAILLAFTLQLLLGFEVTNQFVYYGSCILISEAFLAIIMFLFFNFQDIGKFLSLIFLVLQLASCGGTFPIQTEPKVYQLIYPYMPMTYSVDLLRESFVSINSSFLTKDILIMLAIIVVFNILIFITSFIKSKKQKNMVHNDSVNAKDNRGVKNKNKVLNSKKINNKKR